MKYLYVVLAALSVIVIAVLLFGIAVDIYHVFRPYNMPTSIYTSHATALKLFAIAALGLVVGLIMRLLKV